VLRYDAVVRYDRETFDVLYGGRSAFDFEGLE
jgi:hypothetical protein